MVGRILLSADAIRVSRDGIDAINPPTLDESSLVFSSGYGAIDRIHAHTVVGPFYLNSGKQPDLSANTYFDFVFPALSRIPNIQISIRRPDGKVYNQSYHSANFAGNLSWGHVMAYVELAKVRVYPALIIWASIYGFGNIDNGAHGNFYYAVTVFKP